MSDLVYSFRRIHMKFWLEKMWGPFVDFPGGTVVKNLPASAGDAGDSSSILESGGSPEGGNGNSLQYSCLENPWTEEPGGLRSMELQRVGHDWAHTCMLRILCKSLVEHANETVTYLEPYDLRSQSPIFIVRLQSTLQIMVWIQKRLNIAPEPRELQSGPRNEAKLWKH